MLSASHRRLLKYFAGIVPLVFFIGFSILLAVTYSPEKIIEFLGVQNAYVLIFVTAIFGGFTTFNVIPYHIILITLAGGGLNPILLGSLAAIGVTLGDSTSYFVGYQSRTILSEKMGAWFERIRRLAADHPRRFMLICFAYSCIVPASNDFLTIPQGLARIPFWKTMIPLAFGNIVFDISLAFLAAHTYDSILSLFSLSR